MPSNQSDQRDPSDIAQKMGQLLKLDLDAISGYDQAIEKAETQDVRSHLSTYRDDHQRHVNEITQLVATKGLEQPEPAPELTHGLAAAMGRLQDSKRDHEILRAMRDIERVANRLYDDASREPRLPPEAAELIERNLSDERRHLQWIDQELSANLERQSAM